MYTFVLFLCVFEFHGICLHIIFMFILVIPGGAEQVMLPLIAFHNLQ